LVVLLRELRLKIGGVNCGSPLVVSWELTNCFSIISIIIKKPLDSHELGETTGVLLFDFLGTPLMSTSLIDSVATFLTLLRVACLRKQLF